MDKVAGVIAEYNPFHNGHLYHLKETREKTGARWVVAVMSGNFVQRGEAAVFDKWSRAECALRNGADLVLELPFPFACNHAECFARGAVGILAGLSCVTHLSFGSETGELSPLWEAARLLVQEEEGFKIELKKSLKEGLSYPRARWEAFGRLYGAEAARALEESNNILAVEYLKEALRLNWEPEVLAVKRRGAGHRCQSLREGEETSTASATALRREMRQALDPQKLVEYLPPRTLRMLQSETITHSLRNLYPLLVYRILTARPGELSEVFSAGEGLENKLRKGVLEAADWDGLGRAVKSKRYTETRVNRLLVHTLMDFRKKDMKEILEQELLYARVLGFTGEGASLLKKIKRQGRGRIPILTNINKELEGDDPLRALLHWDVLASHLYHLNQGRNLYENSDFLRKPVIL